MKGRVDRPGQTSKELILVVLMAEHTLEEVALHQQNIERLELVQEACPRLKILLLHDNVISKIGASTMDASRSKLVVD